MRRWTPVCAGARVPDHGHSDFPTSLASFVEPDPRSTRTCTSFPVNFSQTVTMPYTPILATLGYVFSPDGRRVLMIHRNARPDDAHLGKYNGLGGKLEPGEDVVAGLKREIREEAGIECDAVMLVGTISWPGFGKHGEDWFGFIFRVEKFSGTPLSANTEGALEWVEVERVPTLPLWDGDKFFLPLVFDPTAPQFHGVMPYRDGKPLSWSYSTVLADA